MKKFLLILALIALPVSAFAGTIERVSLSDVGVQGANHSFDPAISADGLFAAFQSASTNLVTGDANGQADIFIRDRVGSTTELVSVSSAGTQGDAQSDFPSLSEDGRYVAFWSRASNLVAGDTGGSDDVFVRDRNTDTTERVSVTYNGSQANSDSYPGAYNYHGGISSDGRYVAFLSYATNMVAGGMSGTGDVFVRDRVGSTTELVSMSTLGVHGDNSSSEPTISADGRYVSFESSATNLVAGDTNGVDDVFVYDRNTDTIERVSLSDAAAQGNAASGDAQVSPDGRYVTFTSSATNLVAGDTNAKTDIFVYDRNTDTIERVSVSDAAVEGDNNSYASSISEDGQYISFTSTATNLVAGDTNAQPDIFVYNRNANTIQRVSVADGDVEANNFSDYSSITPDGLHVVFRSTASNLVAGDTNVKIDDFVVTLTIPDTTAPIITILGDNPAEVTEGNTYTDAGATAEDDTDGDITGDINTTGSVDTNTIGTYEIVYDVTDAADNTAYATRTVNVIAEEDNDSGGGSSSRRRTDDPSTPEVELPAPTTDTAKLIEELQIKLIEILKQWVELLMEGH